MGLETASDVQLEELTGETMKGRPSAGHLSTVGGPPGPGSASQNASLVMNERPRGRVGSLGVEKPVQESAGRSRSQLCH